MAAPRRRRRLRRALIGVVSLAMVVFVAFWSVGYLLFFRSHDDPLRKADAIIVLGGEHDGREQYGIDLARRGYAPVVLLSDPYDRFGGRNPDPVMDVACAASSPGVQVICFHPDPTTTLGEARYAAKLATARGWTSIIVITWRFHLVRADYIFSKCFPGTRIMRAVPRTYPSSITYWGFNFAYQYGGLAKALVQSC